MMMQRSFGFGCDSLQSHNVTMADWFSWLLASSTDRNGLPVPHVTPPCADVRAFNIEVAVVWRFAYQQVNVTSTFYSAFFHNGRSILRVDSHTIYRNFIAYIET
jgi:hypothetical protein